jgi:hypothetical protein
MGGEMQQNKNELIEQTIREICVIRGSFQTSICATQEVFWQTLCRYSKKMINFAPTKENRRTHKTVWQQYCT